MRRIYLVRHGQPLFPGGESLCIGSTDLPLSGLGRMQARLTAEYLAGKDISALYSSPLIRAVQTAEHMDMEIRTLPGLSERSAGDWEGLSFTEIKRRWPELYLARGLDPSIPMPDSESDESCSARFEAAVLSALRESRGDIALFSHRSISCAWLSRYSALSQAELRRRLGYCSVSTIVYEGGFRPIAIGERPLPPMTAPLARELTKAWGTPENVRAHCRLVGELAGHIAGELGLDRELCLSAGLLHDIVRLEKRHPQAGAELIAALGYPRLGDIILQHHQLQDPAHIDEAAAVYIADKQFSGTAPVTLEERFAESAAKCRTAEARQAHSRRLAQARSLKTRINTTCGKELIK